MLISVGSRSVLHVNMDESTLVHCAGEFSESRSEGWMLSRSVVLVYHGHIDVISHGFSMAEYRCHPISR